MNKYIHTSILIKGLNISHHIHIYFITATGCYRTSIEKEKIKEGSNKRSHVNPFKGTPEVKKHMYYKTINPKFGGK